MIYLGGKYVYKLWYIYTQFCMLFYISFWQNNNSYSFYIYFFNKVTLDNPQFADDYWFVGPKKSG